MGPKPLRVGSWPGPSWTGNAFVGIFCRSLEEQGIAVVDVTQLSQVDPDAIDVLHIHWPDQIFWDTRGLGAVRALFAALSHIRRLRRKGVKIVWLVHNLKPHDASGRKQALWDFYSRRLLKLIDGYLSLSPATLPIIAQALNFRADAKSLALRHPRYFAKSAPKDTAQARAHWGVPDGKVSLVFAGMVRPYKGVHELAEIVGREPSGRYHLTISGHTPLADYEEQLRAISEAYSSVHYAPGGTDDDTFETLIASADYVVLPFVDTLHSGSIVHALSLGRAVLTPRTPYAADLQEQVGEAWLKLYDGPLSERHLKNLGPPPSGEPDLSALSHARFGEELAGFYRALGSGDG
ncbi:MAG: hypothetical protein AAF291_05340 [Pseudomonadota bacterium]